MEKRPELYYGYETSKVCVSRLLIRMNVAHTVHLKHTHFWQRFTGFCRMIQIRLNFEGKSHGFYCNLPTDNKVIAFTGFIC